MKNILLVEDEGALANILVNKLTQMGFTMKFANNGQEGLQMALNDHPDLILLDIIMPVMDGMTMLQKLRSDSWGKKVNVMLLTNLSDPNKINESKELGVSDYLIKSDWTLEDIVTAVSKKMEK